MFSMKKEDGRLSYLGRKDSHEWGSSLVSVKCICIVCKETHRCWLLVQMCRLLSPRSTEDCKACGGISSHHEQQLPPEARRQEESRTTKGTDHCPAAAMVWKKGEQSNPWFSRQTHKQANCVSIRGNLKWSSCKLESQNINTFCCFLAWRQKQLQKQ